MADWTPKSAQAADDEWVPQSARIPVEAHTRAQPGFLKRLAQEQSKNLPAYGAALGAALGAPALAAGQVEVPVGMAMLGAGSGKALQQSLAGPLGMEPPPSLAQAYIDQANTAAIQGALEGVPPAALQGARSLAGAFAKSQMSKALSPAKSIVRNFPSVVEDALRQGASVNRWQGKGGAQAAKQVMRDATGKVVGLLRAATQRGESIDIESIAKPAIELVERKSGPMSAAERAGLIAKVQDRADELLLKSVIGSRARSSKLMSPEMADELRKISNRSARSTLTAESMGLPTGADPDLDRLIAKGAQQAVNRLREIGPARAAEKTAIGVARATREAELRPNPAAIGVGLGPVKLGVGVPPGAASRLAGGAYSASEALQNPILAASIISNFLRTLSTMAPGSPAVQQ